MTQEEWRSVLGYEGLYEVSSLGRVRSLSRVVERRNGRAYTIPGRILKCTVSKRGYRTVTLYRNFTNSSRGVHQLVAGAFIPNPESLPVVRHYNDDKMDNSRENLRWGTQGDNIRDIVRNGNYRSYWGEKTECKRGHDYSDENTYLDPRGRRRCRTCRKSESGGK